MFSKLTASIKNSIIIAMIFAISLVLGISGAYQYSGEKQKKIEALHDLSDRITDRLSASLALPLWELDTEWVNKILDNEMTEQHVFSISVTGEGDIVTRKGGEKLELEAEESINNNFIISYRDIYHDEQLIGHVEIVISPKYIGLELRQQATNQIMSTLYLIVIIIILLVIGLDKLVIGPINKFVKVAKAISEGDYHSEIDSYKQDEIASLAMSISQMQADIVKRENERDLVTLELAKSNTSLEQRVHERTAELERQHIFLEVVLDSIKDGIVACDENGDLTLFNQATRDIHGIQEEKLPATEWANHYSLFLTDGKTPMTEDDIPLFKAFNGEKVDNIEMIIKPERSPQRLVNSSGSAMFDSDGNKLGAVVSLHDITSQKRAEEALHKAVSDAEQANHAKSIFLANMSHELRTPLNAIIGFSQLMQNNSEVPVDEIKNLDIINRSGQHLLKLINDVLDMSKIEAGQVELELVDLDLGEMLRDVTDMMHLRADEKGVELIVDQTSSFPRFIHADGAKIRQIFINLLSNAVKFTDKGKINVRLAAKKGSGQEITLTCDVEDTGIGMNSDGIKNVFHPFTQLGHSLQQAGTGLGLTITKQFIEMMEGEIEVSSTEGKGSTFSFMIKVGLAEKGGDLAEKEAASQEVIGLELGQPDFRILIVEDQIESQLLLQKLLEPVGFKVKVANNGKEALTIFQEWHPHLIWMDQRMPIMDGFEATKRIKALPEGKVTKIVVLTASVLGEHKRLAFENGADDFLGKPYKIDEIFDCMTRNLGVRYLYKEEISDQQSPALTKEKLEEISEHLLEELSDAAVALDIEQALDVIEKIRLENGKIAEELTSLVNNLDFEILQDLLANKEFKE